MGTIAIAALGIYFQTTFEMLLLSWSGLMAWLIWRTAIIALEFKLRGNR